MLFNDIAGEGAACRLSGEQSRGEASAIYKSLIAMDRALRILLITPEKLIKSKLLMSRFEKASQIGRLKRFVIDEAPLCPHTQIRLTATVLYHTLQYLCSRMLTAISHLTPSWRVTENACNQI